ncbi:MAG: PspC domain-containing protein [Muribaculaceae bacterium]|nr:PspC domain-containing protein [Muribaculaceae bacterium]
MKQTYNINIAGRPYIIDADAYEMLHDYLETLRHAFAKEADSSELLDDIEARIAELLSEDLEATGSSIVTIREVRGIISRIGRPEEMVEIEVEADVNVNTQATPPPMPGGAIPPQPCSTLPKRLFRDPNDKLLGGVCSGIAAYLGIDPTWVRLIVVVLCFLSFSTVAIVYFILWIVIPEATTPLQRMQMRGEPPTVENIGEAVTSEFNPGPGDTSGGVRGFVSSLMRICAVMAKVMLVILCIIFTPVLIALIVAFFACIVALVGISAAPLDFITNGLLPGEVNSMLAFSIALILVIGIPLAVIVLMAINSQRGRQAISRSAGITLSIIWILAIAAAIKTGNTLSHSIPGLVEHVDRTAGIISDEADALQPENLADSIQASMIDSLPANLPDSPASDSK